MKHTTADFLKRPSLYISMQYFAEPDSGTADTGTNANAEQQGGKQQAEPTFDDVLKNKAYQSEFDKRVNQALEKQRTKLDADYKARAAEAEKLAKMNAEEKAAHEREKKEKALAEREAAVTRRELTAEAKVQLAEKGLPAALSSILDYTDAEKCKESIELVSKTFNDAVNDAVNERLRSKEPPKKGQDNTGSAFEKMTYSEKCEYIEKHPDAPEVKAFLGKI